jgi:hypothetical protein
MTMRWSVAFIIAFMSALILTKPIWWIPSRGAHDHDG